MIGIVKRIAFLILCGTGTVACSTGTNAVESVSVQPVSPSLSSYISSSDASHPLRWEGSAVRLSEKKAIITVKAAIQSGWHIYGFKMPEGGPAPTVINFSLPEGVRLDGKLKPSRKLVRKFDEMFESEIEFWPDGDVEFNQTVVLVPGTGSVTVKCNISCMACNDETCLPSRKVVVDVVVPENIKGNN